MKKQQAKKKLTVQRESVRVLHSLKYVVGGGPVQPYLGDAVTWITHGSCTDVTQDI